MTHSPLGLIPFDALGRRFHLKFGNAARFRVEQVFETGFAAAVLQTFPAISRDAVMAGDNEAVQEAITDPLAMRFASIAMLFTCGIVERIGDDDADAIVEELGYPRVAELIGEAFAASSPAGGKDAAARAPEGEAKPGKRRKS
jgi:hypothetical protein